RVREGSTATIHSYHTRPPAYRKGPLQSPPAPPAPRLHLGEGSTTPPPARHARRAATRHLPPPGRGAPPQPPPSPRNPRPRPRPRPGPGRGRGVRGKARGQRRLAPSLPLRAGDGQRQGWSRAAHGRGDRGGGGGGAGGGHDAAVHAVHDVRAARVPGRAAAARLRAGRGVGRAGPERRG